MTLVACCLALLGCVSPAMIFTPPKATLASELSDTEAKRFRMHPGKASVYVIREDTFAGQASLFHVSLDGTDQGKLSRGTYFLFIVEPGKHVINFNGNAQRDAETIYAVEGGIYYLEIRPKSGMAVSPATIRRIDQKRGRRLVRGGKRARILSTD